MMHGDISNSTKATYGFMLNDLVLKYKDNNLTDKFLNAVIGKTKRAEINNVVTGVMSYIYRQTEFNVDLLIDEKDYTADLKNIIGDLPFNRVVLYNKYSQISSRLLTGDLTYVISDSDYERGLINSRYAITLNELTTILKIGGRKG